MSLIMSNDLIAMLEYLEMERDIDRETLFELVEDSLAKAARKELGPYEGLEVQINRRNGQITTTAEFTVVKKVEDKFTQMTVDKVSSKFPKAKVDDVIQWELSSRKGFTRIAAQSTKQAILHRLRQVEKERVVEEFSNRLGELMMGVVRQFEKGDLIVDFGRAEGSMGPGDRVPTEDYQTGDHITVVLTGINTTHPGPSLIVSRTSTNLVKKLFEREVSEIAENIVEIKAIAREPGYRTKIAVHSSEERVDPVGACVGMRGARVKAIVRELNREKIDIVRWHEDIKQFITEALKPAEFVKLEINQDRKSVSIITTEDQYSLAIGKRGQNARLTSKLTGWKVDVLKQKERDAISFEEKINKVKQIFLSIPDVSEEVAQALVLNGYNSVDGLLEADAKDLAEIDCLDLAAAEQILAHLKAQSS